MRLIEQGLRRLQIYRVIKILFLVKKQDKVL